MCAWYRDENEWNDFSYYLYNFFLPVHFDFESWSSHKHTHYVCVFVLFEIDGLLAITRNFVFGTRNSHFLIIYSSSSSSSIFFFISLSVCATLGVFSFFYSNFSVVPLVYTECNAVLVNEQSKNKWQEMSLWILRRFYTEKHFKMVALPFLRVYSISFP